MEFTKKKKEKRGVIKSHMSHTLRLERTTLHPKCKEKKNYFQLSTSLNFVEFMLKLFCINLPFD